jgi:hypothetical protein
MRWVGNEVEGMRWVFPPLSMSKIQNQESCCQNFIIYNYIRKNPVLHPEGCMELHEFGDHSSRFGAGISKNFSDFFLFSFLSICTIQITEEEMGGVNIQ